MKYLVSEVVQHNEDSFKIKKSVEIEADDVEFAMEEFCSNRYNKEYVFCSYECRELIYGLFLFTMSNWAKKELFESDDKQFKYSNKKELKVLLKCVAVR